MVIKAVIVSILISLSSICYADGTVTIQRTNLLANPSFEVLGSWSVASVIYSLSTTKLEGTYSALVTTEVDVSDTAIFQTVTGGTSGKSYTFSCWIKGVNITHGSFYVEIEFPPGLPTQQTVAYSNDTWQQITVSATSTGTSIAVYLGWFDAVPITSKQFLVDQCVLAPTSMGSATLGN